MEYLNAAVPNYEQTKHKRANSCFKESIEIIEKIISKIIHKKLLLFTIMKILIDYNICKFSMSYNIEISNDFLDLFNMIRGCV